MSDQLPNPVDQLDGLSVQAAAEHLGCSEKTVRRRIKAGNLRASKKPTSQGYEWRVYLNGQAADHLERPAAQVDTQVDHASSHDEGHADQGHPQRNGHVDAEFDQADGTLIFRSVETDQALLKALEITERLQRENMELAGRVGFLQAKLQATEEKLLALTEGATQPQPAVEDKPSEDGAKSQPEAVKRPWWRLW